MSAPPSLLPSSLLSALSAYRGLPREVYALSGARAISALGAFVYPFLTLTLTTRLEMSPAEAGGVVSLIGLTSLCGSALGGWLSDVRSKVSVMISAQLGCALSLGVAGFVSDSLWLIPPLLLSTLSISCIRPASAALIAELTPRHQRARAFSLGHLGTNLGFSIGPLLAGFLFKRAPEWIFWGDGLTTALSSLIVWWSLRGYVPHTHEALVSPHQKPHQGSDQGVDLEAAVEGSVWGVLRARPQLLTYAGLSLLTAMGYAQITFSLPITLSALVGEGSADLFGWVMSGNGLFVLLLTPLLTLRADETPHLKALARGALLFALGFGVLALAPALLPIALGVSWPLYVLLALSVGLWTAGEVYTFNHGSAFVAQETPSSHRGRVNGVLPLIIGLTRSLAPLLSGALMAHLSLQSLWLLIGALSLCASLGFMWTRAWLGEGR